MYSSIEQGNRNDEKSSHNCTANISSLHRFRRTDWCLEVAANISFKQVSKLVIKTTYLLATGCSPSRLEFWWQFVNIKHYFHTFTVHNENYSLAGIKDGTRTLTSARFPGNRLLARKNLRLLILPWPNIVYETRTGAKRTFVYRTGLSKYSRVGVRGGGLIIGIFRYFVIYFLVNEESDSLPVV